MAIKRTKVINDHISNLEAFKTFIEELYSDKSESFENKSDNWKESEKGEEAQQDINDLEELSSDLDSSLSKAEDLFEQE